MRVRGRSGRVLTIFLVVIAVLLITLTGACIFFWNLEIEKRKAAEVELSKTDAKIQALQQALAAAKKEKFLLKDKNKEADEKINNLLDELDLEKGLREEMKLESADLKTKVETAAKEKKKLEDNLTAKEKQIKDLEDKLQLETNRNEELVKRNQQLEATRKDLGSVPGEDTMANGTDDPVAVKSSGPLKKGVELGDIVIAGDKKMPMADKMKPQGRILSVDEETEFIVVNLGEKDDIHKGTRLSVYRGNDYLGDVRVTRVQPEMAAADFIPPLTSHTVRKNDQVIVK